jgi:predicted phosphoribosyltransferase
MTEAYRDRAAAGVALAHRLARYASAPNVVVLGLVRGGLPVAAAAAARLGAPLDVLVVCKLGVPWAPELALGALGTGGVRVLNSDVAARLDGAEINAVANHEAEELRRREARYRAGRPALAVKGRTAILVDDGLVTGATARAAVAVMRKLGASRVVVAAPIGSTEAYGKVGQAADEIVVPLTPSGFSSVGRYYADFHQVTDDEVMRLLAGAG